MNPPTQQPLSGFLIIGLLWFLLPLSAWFLNLHDPQAFIFQIQHPLTQLTHMQHRDHITLALTHQLKKYLDKLDVLNTLHFDLYHLLHSPTTPHPLQISLLPYLFHLRKTTDGLKNQLWLYLVGSAPYWCKTSGADPCVGGPLVASQHTFSFLRDLAPFKPIAPDDPKYLEIRSPERQTGYFWLTLVPSHAHWLTRTPQERHQALQTQFLAQYFSTLHLRPHLDTPHRIRVSPRLYSPHIFLDKK